MMTVANNVIDRAKLIEEARTLYLHISFCPSNAHTLVSRIREILRVANSDASILDSTGMKDAESVEHDLDVANMLAILHRKIALARKCYRRLSSGEGDAHKLANQIFHLLLPAGIEITALDPTGNRTPEELMLELKRAGNDTFLPEI